jgi:hypothetical protein
LSEKFDDLSSDRLELGALLTLLHSADAAARTVAVTYRVWRHQARLTEAFIAAAEARKRDGASVQIVSIEGTRTGDRAPEPEEREATLRIWRDGKRVRVEHHGGERDGYYAVADPPLWWMWDERMGARSNQGDPSVGNNVGQEMEIMLDPAPLLSTLYFRVTGSAEVAGRATITARATPRPVDERFGPSLGLSSLGSGADHYELEIDAERGLVLAATALRNDLPFHKITTLTIALDEPIAPETFHFEPPEGEEIISSSRDRHARQNVTLVEAQQLAPFTVLMLDTVPEGWQQMNCAFTEASARPPAPAHIFSNYRSGDGHESISITQTAAEEPNPFKRGGDPENWEELTRDGIALKTRPSRWGQAQVQLERDGTYVFLMSPNLTQDQLVNLAFGLRPAPDTSSV